MRSFKELLNSGSNVALISIRPEFVNLIISGEKNIEFRRVWPKREVDLLIIYATAPVQKIVAIVKVVDVARAAKSKLWTLGQAEGGGISRSRLFEYFQGCPIGAGIRLGDRLNIRVGINPRDIFGSDFIAPQSFRYVKEVEKRNLLHHLEDVICE